jgi:hypothetical protein
MLKIPGYKFLAFRRDRVGKMGGGVMVFVKDHITIYRSVLFVEKTGVLGENH